MRHHGRRDTPVAPPLGVELEAAPCPLGCASDDALVVRGFDRLHGLGGRFEVVRCRSCDLMRTTPRPTAATIHHYYPADYGPHVPGPVNPSVDAPNPRPLWKRALRRVLPAYEEFPPGLAPGRFLEVGCGAGATLEVMARRGWQTYGIEPGRDAAQIARRGGREVFAGPLEGAPEPSSPYDLIGGLMVLEHLHEPIAALRRLRGWSHPGTLLVLSVPNAASLERRIFGDAWYALQLPTHLFHYTPSVMPALLAAGGWHLRRLFHQPTLSNAIVSTGYVLGDLGAVGAADAMQRAAKSRAGWAMLAPITEIATRAGQTGRMTLWAEAGGEERRTG